MSRFTLDSASEFLFGHCMHALSGDLPFPHNIQSDFPLAPSTSTTPPPVSTVQEATRATEFADAFLEAQEVIAIRERYGWTWPLTEMWGDRSKKSMKVVNAYLAPIIRDAIQKKEMATRVGMEKEGKDAGVEDGETLIDHLVAFTSGM